MPYKGKEIGIPTLELIQECISQWNLRVSAQEVFEHWASRNWLTKKGQAVKTLESACNVANSLFVQRQRKGVNNDISKSEAVARVKDWVVNNIPNFIEAMELIREENPQEWARLYSELTRRSVSCPQSDVS